MSEASYPQPDRRRPEPLWYQVEQAIRAIVKSGEWATGAQIPAEDRLCAMFGVSRITLRHALRNLEEHGLLRREHGRGTFVRSTTLVAGTRELTSFTQEMSHLGLVVGSRLLDCSLTTANAATAAALEIDEGDPVVRIRRLRLGNDAPIGIQTAQLSTARAPAFSIPDRCRARSTRRWKSATASCRSGARGLSRRRGRRRGCGAARPCRGQPGLRRRAHHHRRARPVRIHRLGHARRSLRDQVDTARRPRDPRERPLTSRPPFSAGVPHRVRSLHFPPRRTHRDRRPKTNADAFDQAAGPLRRFARGGGLIHLYGSGHSVLPCQEVFPRYGTYVGFNPLTDPRVMWHNVLGAGGVRELLWLERTENYAEKFLDHQPLNKGDSIIIFGHSGRNASGIDTALYAKKRGIFVVAITARTISTSRPRIRPASGWPTPPTSSSTPARRSRTRSCRSTAGAGRSSGSSTVLAMILAHELIARTAQNLAKRGIELPVFASPTIAGVTLHDTDIIYGVYRERMLDAQRRHLPRSARRWVPADGRGADTPSVRCVHEGRDARRPGIAARRTSAPGVGRLRRDVGRGAAHGAATLGRASVPRVGACRRVLTAAKRHGLVASNETGLFAADDDYRVPDIVISRPANRSHRGVDGTAELVVELRSPGDESYEKLSWYAARGVTEMLIVDPATRRFELYRNHIGAAAAVEPDDDGGITLDTLGVRCSPWRPARAHDCGSSPTPTTPTADEGRGHRHCCGQRRFAIQLRCCIAALRGRRVLRRAPPEQELGKVIVVKLVEHPGGIAVTPVEEHLGVRHGLAVVGRTVAVHPG